MLIRPASGRSSPAMHRSTLLLPDPEAPASTITPEERSMSKATSSEKLPSCCVMSTENKPAPQLVHRDWHDRGAGSLLPMGGKHRLGEPSTAGVQYVGSGFRPPMSRVLAVGLCGAGRPESA